MRCFYCPTLSKGRIELSPEEERHIFSVNRLRVAERLLFIDGEGLVAEAELLKDKTFKIIDLAKQPEPSLKLHLFVAPPRKQQMDQIIEQSSEVGIWSITPIITQRAVSIPEKNSDNSRWKIKIIESCKQSRNPYFPTINQHLSLSDAVIKVKELKFSSFYGSTDTKETPKVNLISSDIAWFVGPEGGFSPEEVDLMQRNNSSSLKFGTAVMRVETAAIAGSACLLNTLILK